MMDQNELNRLLENLYVAYKHPVSLPYPEMQKTTFDGFGGRTSTDACVCVVTHDDLGNILDYIADLQQLASDMDAQNQMLIKEIAETVRRI